MDICSRCKRENTFLNKVGICIFCIKDIKEEEEIKEAIHKKGVKPIKK